MSYKIIAQVAQKTFMVNIKNYWLLLVAFILLVLNYGIIHFSVSMAGFNKQGNPQAIILSLIHLQMYVLSLFALLISYDGMLQERELGTLDLLLSYPLQSSEVVLGKWLGFNAILILAFLIGFGPSLFNLLDKGVGVNIIAKFILFSTMLGLIFTSLGLFLSAFSKSRTVVIASCIILWIVFVFLFDLGFVALVIKTNGVLQQSATNWILLLNPIDSFRMISLISFMPKDASQFYGLNTGALQYGYILFSLFLWIIIPLILTMKKNFVIGKGVHYAV